jgi:hypothetical protein
MRAMLAIATIVLLFALGASRAPDHHHPVPTTTTVPVATTTTILGQPVAPRITSIRWYGPWNGWAQTFAEVNWYDPASGVLTFQVWREATPDVLVANEGATPGIWFYGAPNFNVTSGCWYVDAIHPAVIAESQPVCSSH